MERIKVLDGDRRNVEWCKEHPDSFNIGCQACHQANLAYIELRLMELHEEIKSLFGHAQWDMSEGAYSPWGWTGQHFKVEWKPPAEEGKEDR